MLAPALQESTPTVVKKDRLPRGTKRNSWGLIYPNADHFSSEAITRTKADATWTTSTTWDQLEPAGDRAVWGQMHLRIESSAPRNDTRMVIDLVEEGTGRRQSLFSGQLCGLACDITFSFGPDHDHPFNLQPGARYYVEYRAFDGTGDWSPKFTSPMYAAVGKSAPTIPAEQSGPCGCGDSQGYALDPVNTATGTFFETVDDLPATGPGQPMGLSRTYNSASTVNNGLGVGWAWSYASRLVISTDEVVWHAADGTVTRFAKVGSKLIPPPGSRARLVQSSSGYTLRLPRGSEQRFSSTGALVKVTDVNGTGVTVTSTGGVVSKVTNAVGRSITFDALDGKIVKSTTWDGRTVTFGYTGDRLTSVTDVRGGTTTYRYDAGGRLDRITRPSGLIKVTNTYDAAGRIFQQVDGAGKMWKLGWDSTGTIATTTDPNGGKWVDTYKGRVLQSRTDPAGFAIRYTYDWMLNPTGIDVGGPGEVLQTFDDRGNVLTRTAPGSSSKQTFTYNSLDQVLTRTDFRGNKTTNAYLNNRLHTITAPGGAAGIGTTKFTYLEPLGLLSSMTTPEGRAHTYTYDTLGQTKSSKTPKGEVTTFDYDPASRVKTITDPRGTADATKAEEFTRHLEYDAAGNIEKVITPRDTVIDPELNSDGYVTRQKTTSAQGAVLEDLTYEVDPMGRVTAEKDAKNAQKSWTFDSRGNLDSETDATGAVTRYTYNSRNLVDTKTTARGNVTGADPAAYRWKYGYDSRGNLTSQTDPHGSLKTWQVNGRGQVTTATDTQGRVTTTAYDADGRQRSFTNALTKTWTWTWDTGGRLYAVQEPGLAASTYTYDKDGLRLSETSPSKASTTQWRYDLNGAPAKITTPRGVATTTTPDDYTTTIERDPAGNVASVTNALGQTTTSSYDAENDLIAQTSPRGGTTQWERDGLGRPTSVTTPTGEVTHWAYDTVGNLSKVTNAKGKVTTYEYSPRGERTASIDPLNRRWSYAFDPEGNLVETVTGRGNANAGAQRAKHTITQAYDALGQRTKLTTSEASSTSSYTYYPEGALKSVTDATGTTNLAYDDVDQLTSSTGPMGAFGYTYSARGDVATRTLPTFGTVTSTFDTDGRVDTSSSDSTSTSFGYDLDSNLASITYPTESGLDQTRTTDAAGNVRTIETTRGTTLVSKYSYTYDAAGNPFRETVTRGSTTKNTAYNHDLSDRLIKECHNATGCSSATDVDVYSYDAMSAISSITNSQTGRDERRVYDNADQMLKSWDAATTPEPTTSTTYDADGNPTTGGATWDALGRNTTSTGGGVKYVYNGMGNRVSRTQGTETTAYKWDNNNPLPTLAIMGPAGEEPTRAYRYAPDGSPLSAQHLYGEYKRTHFVTDRQGSVREALKPDGATAYRHDYRGYGAQETPSKSSVRVAPLRGYTGELTDPGTDRIHLRARDYDATGAFSAPDPVTPQPGTPWTSRYTYVEGKPMTHADPTGLVPIGLPGTFDFDIDWAPGGAEYEFGFAGRQIANVTGRGPGDAAVAMAWQTAGGVIQDDPRILADIAGSIPVVGAPIDIINAGGYAYEGNWTAAGLTAAGVICDPLQWGRNSAKLGKAINGLDDAGRLGPGIAHPAGAARKSTNDSPLSTPSGKTLGINFEPKIQKQLGTRGWTEQSVSDLIQKPNRTVPTRDTRRRPDGGRNDAPATAYIDASGSYVVRNNQTGDIVQVSNKNKPDWKSPW